MEASDPFATGVSDPGDDPFAGADEQFEQERAERVAAEAEAADAKGADLPVVNAEGERISPSPVDGGQVATQVTSSGDEDTTATSEALGVSAPPDPAEAQDPPPAGNPDSPSSPEASEDGGSSASADASGETIALPEELKDKSGKVTHRRYILLQPVGGGKFQQLSWYADTDGKIVGKGEPGAKRQDSCLVRGKTDALQVGFAALGAPLGGVELVAVTSNYWKVRKVEPAPIQPSRTRIKVS